MTNGFTREGGLEDGLLCELGRRTGVAFGDTVVGFGFGAVMAGDCEVEVVVPAAASLALRCASASPACLVTGAGDFAGPCSFETPFDRRGGESIDIGSFEVETFLGWCSAITMPTMS